MEENGEGKIRLVLVKVTEEEKGTEKWEERERERLKFAAFTNENSIWSNLISIPLYQLQIAPYCHHFSWSATILFCKIARVGDEAQGGRWEG